MDERGNTRAQKTAVALFDIITSSIAAELLSSYRERASWRAAERWEIMRVIARKSRACSAAYGLFVDSLRARRHCGVDKVILISIVSILANVCDYMRVVWPRKLTGFCAIFLLCNMDGDKIWWTAAVICRFDFITTCFIIFFFFHPIYISLYMQRWNWKFPMLPRG